jgi:UDP-GlcNAc:undecaprenyl-phosphate GlcNAc-1-phosphate transferase
MTNNYILLASAFFSSLILTYVFIPSIIKVAEIKHLFDEEDVRKSHEGVVPTLGGVGIFAGFIIGFCLFATFISPQSDADKVYEIKYVLAAMCFMFMLGSKDDIVELVHTKKFVGQIFAASMVVILGDIRITSLYGLFDISQIGYVFSVLLTITTIIFIVNAFNIIDGINTLSASLGILSLVAFGSWFYYYGFIDYAIMAMAMMGALVAFIRFNYTPARIFMGDSGSLSIGLLMAILAIQFIEKNEVELLRGATARIHIAAAPAMAVAVLIIPLFDTLRAFTLRILHKKSPFVADRNHIHHRIIDLGFSHIQATALLILVNIIIIIISYLLQSWGNLYLMLFQLSLCMLLAFLLFSVKLKKVITARKDENTAQLSLEMEVE